jgi:hypothetical protein
MLLKRLKGVDDDWFVLDMQELFGNILPTSLANAPRC